MCKYTFAYAILAGIWKYVITFRQLCLKCHVEEDVDLLHLVDQITWLCTSSITKTD